MSDPLTILTSPATYRELHEDAAGMGLDESFFAVSKIDPNARVRCNCAWADGHAEYCDIVSANRILMSRRKKGESAHISCPHCQHTAQAPLGQSGPYRCSGCNRQFNL